MPCSRAAARASGTPSIVSWSVSASSSTPAAAACATTSAAGSAPSEWIECDWRSKVGRMRTECGGKPLRQPQGGEDSMSTGAIIAIVAIVIIVIALSPLSCRGCGASPGEARERELEQRRERVAGEHRAEARERAAAGRDGRAEGPHGRDGGQARARRGRAARAARAGARERHGRPRAGRRRRARQVRRHVGGSRRARPRCATTSRCTSRPRADYERGRFDEARDAQEEDGRFTRDASPSAPTSPPPARRGATTDRVARLRGAAAPLRPQGAAAR